MEIQISPYLILLLVLFLIVLLLSATLIFKKLFTSRKSTSEELRAIENLEERNKTFAATVALNNIVLQTLDFDLLAQRIANAIPQFLGYETGVLATVDELK